MIDKDTLQYHDSGVKQGYNYYKLVDNFHIGNYVCNKKYSNNLVSYLPSVEKIGFNRIASEYDSMFLTIYKEPRGSNYGLETISKYRNSEYKFFL